jgi:hypothetical protein
MATTMFHRTRVFASSGQVELESKRSLPRSQAALVPAHKVEDSINAARLCFPRIWLDRESCAAGLEALRQYRADFDEKTKAFKNRPWHDWTSHAADAFRYLAMAWQEPAKPALPPQPKPLFLPPSDMTVDEYERLEEPDPKR